MNNTLLKYTDKEKILFLLLYIYCFIYIELSELYVDTVASLTLWIW